MTRGKNKRKFIMSVVGVVSILLVSLITTILFLGHDGERIVLGSYDFKNSVIDEYNDVDSLLSSIEKGENKYDILYFGNPDNLSSVTYTKAVNDAAYKKGLRIKAFNLSTVSRIDESDGKKQNSKEYQKIIDWILNLDNSAVIKGYIKESVYLDDGAEYKLHRILMPNYFIIGKDLSNSKLQILDCIYPGRLANVVVEKDKYGNEIRIDDAKTRKQRDALTKEVIKILDKVMK